MKGRYNIAVAGMSLLLFSCSPLGGQLVKTEMDRQEPEGAITGSSADIEAQSRLLDQTTRNIIRSYGSTIRSHSARYGFDWRLILAIMKCESSFDVAAESHKGAVGLMQLMPETGQEVGQALAIDVMTHPTDNIHGGIYYLKRLHSVFGGSDPSDRLRLTLAAYNAGLGRIYDAQEVAAYLHDDPTTWESVKNALPLLSKRYYTLHRNIWEEARPRVGWFGNSQETVRYVDRIMDYYDEYLLVLN
jgi:membrane-bound lytic murein transglycosylase F